MAGSGSSPSLFLLSQKQTGPADDIRGPASRLVRCDPIFTWVGGGEPTAPDDEVLFLSGEQFRLAVKFAAGCEDRIEAVGQIGSFKAADFDVGVAADEDCGRAVPACFAPAPEGGDIAFDTTLIGDADDAPGFALGSSEENDACGLRPVLISAKTLELVGVAVCTAEVDQPVHVLAPFLFPVVFSFCAFRKRVSPSF